MTASADPAPRATALIALRKLDKTLGGFDPAARDSAWADPYDEVPHAAHPRLEVG
jgi:hypothetical protein